MKVVFIGNYYNHHQVSLSRVLYQRLQGQYAFIETCKIPEQRLALGYTQFHEEPFLLSYEREKAACDTVIREADMVIFGMAPQSLLKPAIKTGKLIFRYSERPVKDKTEGYKYLVRLIKWHMYNPQRKPIYLLAAGAYVAYDYRKFGLFRHKAYQWGYFPDTKTYDDVDAMITAKDEMRLLWCGRFLNWKHPDDAIKIAARLKEEGYRFTLDIIGHGEMAASLCQAISENGLEAQVRILSAMSPAEVRTHMEKAGIFLMTSDHMEGWGAVLNEAMNSGCAVVAGHAVGAVPVLIKHRQNGMIYETCNTDMLYEQVKYLLDHPEEQVRLGKAAYETIVKEWNADEAVERLLTVTERLLAGEPFPSLYHRGPCSRAELLSDQWKS